MDVRLNGTTRAVQFSRIVVVLMLESLAIWQSGCKEERLASVWTTAAMSVDGYSSDWNDIPRTIFDDPRASIGVCNDSSRLYILFHINEPDLVLAAKRNGLTIWLTADGRKKKTFGLNYTSAIGAFYRSGRDAPFGDTHEELVDSMRMRFQPPVPEGLALLYGSERNRIPLHAQEAGVPVAGFQSEGGGLTYEFSVPLVAAATQYGLDASLGATIMVGVELGGSGRDKNGPPRSGPNGAGRKGEDDRKDRPDGGQDGPPGGEMGGGMPGADPRGGGMGGHGGPSRIRKQSGNESSPEIWMSVTLATPVSPKL
jgi:hypothetical protein